MDPNANLAAQAQCLANRQEDGKLHNYDRYELYELRSALRAWIGRGGFEPTWAQFPEAAAAYQTWAGCYGKAAQ